MPDKEEAPVVDPHQNGCDTRRTSTVLKKDLQGVYRNQELHHKIRHPKDHTRFLQEDDPENPSQKRDKTSNIVLEQRLGKGGQGETYLGRTEHTVCAVKIIPIIPANDDNAKLVERIENEAVLLSRITKEDSGFVQMSGSGRTTLKPADGPEGDVFYIIMEYVEHENLMTKRVTTTESLNIMEQVANSLKHAHNFKDEKDLKHCIIHRDIKPENILVDSQGVVRVADLGLGKDLTDKNAAQTVGMAGGSPYFMSPEQAKGIMVDGKTDIYSWGTTFYYLLTKSLPFDGENPMAVMNKVRATDRSFKVRDENDKVPIKLAEIVEICTDINREKRFDAEELVHALEMYKETHGYMQKDREGILETTTISKNRLWRAIKKNGIKKNKEKLIELLKAHEKAAWFTSGKERRTNQEQFVEYYKQLNILKADEKPPEDIELAYRVIQKQMNAIHITPNIPPVRLEGRGRGKAKAEKLVNKINQDVQKFWMEREFVKAENTLREVKKEYDGGDVRDRWKSAVLDWIELYDGLIKGSKGAQQADIQINECRNLLVRGESDDLNHALTAYDEAKNLLAQIPAKPRNPHCEQIRVKLAETDASIKQELMIYQASQILGGMATHIDRHQFEEARTSYNEIMTNLGKMLPSNKGDRLRKQVKEMYAELIKQENFYEARRLYDSIEKSMDARTANDYREAQRKAVRIDAIIVEHIQGNNPEIDSAEIEFREYFIKIQEKLNKRSKQFDEFTDIAERWSKEVYPTYDAEINSKFAQGEFPDIEVLRKFHIDINDLVRRIENVEEDAVGADYGVKKRGMDNIQQEVAQKEREYVDAKFKEVEEATQKINETKSYGENKDMRDSALQKIRGHRKVVILLDNEEVYQRHDKLEEDLKEQFDYAVRVGRAREEIAEKDFDEAGKTLSRGIPKSRVEDVAVYNNIIRLEKASRADIPLDQRSQPDTSYSKRTEHGLSDEDVLGYRKTIKDFKRSEETPQVIAMLDDIERKIGFEESPVPELREAVETYSKKRAGQPKDDIKAEILEGLNGVAGSAETYLEEHGEKVLTREMRVELGTAYQEAGFKDKAKDFF